MYKVTADMFHELEKKVKAISRKLKKYNLMHEFKVHDSIVERINVYKLDGATSTMVKVGTKIVEVIPYEFWMESLKLGEWVPVAQIEHDNLIVDGETRNMVKNLNGEAIQDNWYYVDSKCEHCNSNRHRNITIILKNTDGQYKQVGSSCVKEFTGIDAYDIIATYTTINDILLEEAYEITSFNSVGSSPYVETYVYLSHCIKEIDNEGYIKDFTKHSAFDAALKGPADDEFVDRAKAMIDFFKSTDIEEVLGYDQTFYRDIQRHIVAEYVNRSGIVAYAPVAFNKLLSDIEASNNELKIKAISCWQGEVGSKLSVEVTLLKSIGYNTEWGYSYIHLFVDTAGNVYKWGTGKSLTDQKVDGILTGTVKAHDEYDGVKQTALTRCKIA